MSYTNELISIIKHDHPRNFCCKKALAQGILFVKGRAENNSVSIHLYGDEKIETACSIFFDVYGKSPTKEKRAKSGIGTTLVLPSSSALEYVSNISILSTGFTPTCPQCTSFFLKGIFVSCGRITNPQSSYRLELSAADRADIVLAFLQTQDLTATKTKRKNETLLLIKNSAQIEKFFVIMGINKITFDVMNVRIENELKSEIQRITNFETANIKRSVDARDNQLAIIEELKKNNLISSLPKELADTAELRLKMPEASLSLLASSSVPPLTKSGIVHRLSKLTNTARILLGKENE